MTPALRLRQLAKKVARALLPSSAFERVKTRYYARLVSITGAEQEPDLKIVRHLVHPGDTAIDIGANIGVYTRALSEFAGPGGRVYSIEPFPSTFAVLESNVSRLRLDNVQAMNVAVSDRETRVAMGAPPSPSGIETHTRAHIVVSDDDPIAEGYSDIRATTIDASFPPSGPPVSFVKCDVEGHELACLEGASAFLAGSGAAWLIEVSGDPDDADAPAHQVFSILRGHGYSAWRFDGDRLVERRRGDHSVNYFFLKDDHVAALGAKGVALVRAD